MHLSVNPAFFYGPFAPAFTAPYGSSSINGSIISSMILFYKLLLPDAPPSPLEFSPFFTDIRDAAQALVAAIDSPPSSDVGRKRILISSDWVQPTEIFDLVAKERPELASRLSPRVKDFPFEVKRVIDNKRLKEVLGLEVTPWRKTILDSVDAVIKMEDEWKKRGLVPSYL